MSRQGAADENRLNTFLNQLDERLVPYRISKIRPESVMVEVVVPGQRWEIEFMDDGRVEIERFRSNGEIEDESVLHELWALVDDATVPPEPGTTRVVGDPANRSDAP